MEEAVGAALCLSYFLSRLQFVIAEIGIQGGGIYPAVDAKGFHAHFIDAQGRFRLRGMDAKLQHLVVVRPGVQGLCRAGGHAEGIGPHRLRGKGAHQGFKPLFGQIIDALKGHGQSLVRCRHYKGCVVGYFLEQGVGVCAQACINLHHIVAPGADGHFAGIKPGSV